MIKVIGDIMLDRWIIGTADRMSPEAPIPVLKESSQKYSVGGAGNLAMNIDSLNGGVELYGTLAKDKEGFKLLELFKITDVYCNIATDHAVTTTKTRLVGQGGQHILRWDREHDYIGSEPTDRIIESVKKDDLVCVSDYAKGVIRSFTVSSILDKGAKILVDPKQGPEIYRGAFLVKPNMKEYVEWFGKFKKDDALTKCKKYNWEWLVVTDGANGIHALHKDGDYEHFMEPVKEVADVTGAGDTVLAVIAYGIDQGFSVFESCKMACYAAARIVEKRGVVTVTKNDLKPKTVWTNGVFDILHEGHLKLLQFCKSRGEKLVVGINSDDSTKRLKGENRPINDVNQRKTNLELLPWVDEVVVFNDDTPRNAINKCNPDLIVKGGDYTIETVVGHEDFPVEIFPTVQGHSTTKIIEKMK